MWRRCVDGKVAEVLAHVYLNVSVVLFVCSSVVFIPWLGWSYTAGVRYAT